jgi:hypothetical protein
MNQHEMRRAISVVGFVLTGILLSTSLAWAAKDARPFWTEKSSFIEGEELGRNTVVGTVALCAGAGRQDFGAGAVGTSSTRMVLAQSE